MQFFTCDNCGFTFPEADISTIDGASACPDCGKPNIRPATKKEIEVRILAKAEEDEYLRLHHRQRA